MHSGLKIQQGSIKIIYCRVQGMQELQFAVLSEQLQSLLRGKVERECFLCLGEFDLGEYAPVMMCMNQHSCCGPCMQELIKVDASKHIACPHCNQPINRRAVVKNRHLITIFEIVQAFARQVNQLNQQLEKVKIANAPSLKNSLSTRQPYLSSSFILLPEKRDSFLQESTVFEECPTSRSQLWVGGSEKRRELLLTYAQREKIEELKRIAQGDMALEEITKIRSGYGTIKKIECMEIFANLRELFLYNNHIRVIEGLTSNLKLNVLSLAYNRIEKAQNLGHLKELRRLSLECNKLGRASAQYLSLYEWKNLESLTISFHEERREDNEDCFKVLFTGKSLMQWSGLKTLYVYNSKQAGEGAREVLREFVSRRKHAVQVYWS